MMIIMAEELDINQLIVETIDESCTDPNVKKLIKQSLRYELDIWNRYLRKSEIESEYQFILDKIAKEVPR